MSLIGSFIPNPTLSKTHNRVNSDVVIYAKMYDRHMKLLIPNNRSNILRFELKYLHYLPRQEQDYDHLDAYLIGGCIVKLPSVVYDVPLRERLESLEDSDDE